MKGIKEIKFEEMTLEQKLGFVNLPVYADGISDECVDFIFEQIKKRALGAIWVIPDDEGGRDIERIKKIKDAADYPILIVTDAELGMGKYMIGKHNPIAATGDEKYAYAFGKAVAVTARERGYNVICNPLLDYAKDGSARSYGSDKTKVAKFATAEARGMHDGGVLTVAKHYPSPHFVSTLDTHMVEGISLQTEEDLLETGLYSYLELMKEGLLDGLMSKHALLPKIDGEYPASLSKSVIDIIRRQGFDGFITTDALCMMGVRAKHGRVKPMGVAVEAGNDFAMMYDGELIFNQESLKKCYDDGILTPEALDNAVKHILAAQKKVLYYDTHRCTSISEEEDTLATSIEKNAVYAKLDEGLSPNLSPDGKYYFAVMANNSVNTDKPDVDTFSTNWHNPTEICEYLKKNFPNSKSFVFHEFPNQQQCVRILEDSLGFEVVFITYSEFLCYTGVEHFTHRVKSLFEAMQYTNRISTILHCGNPILMGEIPHIPRIILTGASAKGVDAGLDVLTGKIPPRGVLTYEVDFK